MNKQSKGEKPLKGDAWLVRDKYGKMRRAIFFHPLHAEVFIRENRMSRYERIKVRITIDTEFYEGYQ